MITPVEITNKTFKSGGLGYDKKDVDLFIKEIASSFESIYRENMELKDKIGVLNEGLKYYKTIEKTMQRALMLAEKTADETKANANVEAKRIEKEAGAKAEIILENAREEYNRLHEKTVALAQQYERYKAQFKNLAAAQIDLLSTPAFEINIMDSEAFFKPAEGHDLANDELSEIGDSKDSSSGHVFDELENIDEFRFGDLQIDGQEEFDLVDLGDISDNTQ